MGKRHGVVILMVLMFVSTSAQAMETRAVSDKVSLLYDGSTAICSATCKGANTSDKVEATLTLVCKGETVASWSKSGVYSIALSEKCKVVPGRTYTLKLNYTINGVAKPEKSVTRVCQ